MSAMSHEGGSAVRHNGHRQGATFGAATREWLRYVEVDRKRRATTLLGYGYVVRCHLLPEFGEETPLEDITHLRIDAYRERMVADGVASPRSINHRLTILHGVFRRAVRVFGLSHNPVALVDRQPVRPSGDFRVLTPHEVQMLLDAALTEQDRAVFAVAAFAGLRVGEIRALRWGDVDPQLSIIHVRQSYTHYGKFQAPKSGRVRSVPLIPQAAEPLFALRERGHTLEPDDLVFLSPRRRVLNDSRLRRRFYEATKRAGLAHLRLHDLRHSFGTLAVQAFPLTDVAAYMGHADIETTMIYIHHVPKTDAASRLASVVSAGGSSDHTREGSAGTPLGFARAPS